MTKKLLQFLSPKGRNKKIEKGLELPSFFALHPFLEQSVDLGMSITQTILEWYQGKIWFESQENQGTTF